MPFPISFANSASLDSCQIETYSKPVINARKWSAAGDGVADDTAAFQRSIDQASAIGGVVYIHDGTYLVDAVKGLWLKSNAILNLSTGATIKAAKNSKATFGILRIDKVTNVGVIGGVVLGERYAH
ncbi:MAG: hypothetical protein H3C29_03135 [Simplicispira suum]|uniref:glycosyl hydrolase family 28-related protein n=1 Tax=Simplicispira suum TaxID=2109915 RepID=UPI001C6A9C4B|nr:glycosyl hydrolase family 28-related protein [Simplicispira suum]MBW7832186.1 hypothetical protein [Simplicispira suum]